MKEKNALDTKWDQKASTGTDLVHVPNPAKRAEPEPPAKTVVERATRQSEPVSEETRPSVPPAYETRSEEWKRGYLDFRSCAVDRHCAPYSDETWDEYMDGWNQAEQDWEQSRSFPEKVRVQVGKSATITDVSSGEKFHLQTTSVVNGCRVDRDGRIEFRWKGITYSVYPGKHVCVLE